MHSGDSPAGLLAAGAEALTEAAFRTGDYPAAEALLTAARERAEATGDRATEAAALDRLAWSMHFQAIDRAAGHGLAGADADTEEALFARSLAIRRELGDPGGIAAGLFGVGLVRQVLRRDWQAAIRCFREALALVEQGHADDLTGSEVHRHVGFYYLVEEVDLDQARHHLRVSLALRERHGDPRWVPSGALALGQATLVAGEQPEAVRLLREAVRQARAAGLSPQRIDQAEQWVRRGERNDTELLRPRAG